VQSAVAVRSRSFGKEVPAHAAEQASRAHPEDLLRLGVEVRETPLAIDSHESIADAFEDLAGVQRTGYALLGLFGRVQDAAAVALVLHRLKFAGTFLMGRAHNTSGEPTHG
jgi:hypothetical protein